jgi:hypothetical protein
VQAYLYDGYWEDIGTIEAFYNANLGITKKPVPDFRLLNIGYLFIDPTVNYILTIITASLRCFMFVGTLIAVSTTGHLQSTPNLGICLHLRCLMLISPIVLLAKDV